MGRPKLATPLTYLYAALDESSDGYCALVAGEKGAIDQHVRKLPHSFTHMVSWQGSDNEKKSIVSRLGFEGNILVHCAKFGLKELDRKIGDAQLSGRCRMPTTKINNIIGYEMAQLISSIVSLHWIIIFQ